LSIPLFSFMLLRPPRPTLFPYTTLFRSAPKGKQGLRRSDRDRSDQSAVAPVLGDEPVSSRITVHPDLVAQGGNPDALDPHAELRSEEHTSELQSLRHLVCRLLLEKKKKN